jgi:hypothetical protein
MVRKVKGYVILETEIEILQFLFFTDIFVDGLSVALMMSSFYVWINYPNVMLLTMLTVATLIFAGFGIYLSFLCARIWRKIKNDTSRPDASDHMEITGND